MGGIPTQIEFPTHSTPLQIWAEMKEIKEILPSIPPVITLGITIAAVLASHDLLRTFSALRALSRCKIPNLSFLWPKGAFQQELHLFGPAPQFILGPILTCVRSLGRAIVFYVTKKIIENLEKTGLCFILSYYFMRAGEIAVENNYIAIDSWLRMELMPWDPFSFTPNHFPGITCASRGGR